MLTATAFIFVFLKKVFQWIRFYISKLLTLKHCDLAGIRIAKNETGFLNHSGTGDNLSKSFFVQRVVPTR